MDMDQRLAEIQQVVWELKQQIAARQKRVAELNEQIAELNQCVATLMAAESLPQKKAWQYRAQHRCWLPYRRREVSWRRFDDALFRSWLTNCEYSGGVGHRFR
jgi:septal ring factor EnvC (AmiA/AmiB activator)